MIAEAVLQKLNALPQSCLDDVERYIDKISLDYEKKSLENSEERLDAFNNFSKYKGALKREVDYKNELVEALDEKYSHSN